MLLFSLHECFQMKLFCCIVTLLLLPCINAAVDNTIVVKDKLGTILTSYSAQRYDDTVQLYCSLIKNADVDWSITPTITGIYVYENGTLTITTGFILPKTTFTITAATTKGNSTLEFDIEVCGCKYGNFLKFDGLRNSHVQLYRNTELVFNATLSTKYLCLPIATYRYIVTSGEGPDFYMSIEDETGVHLAGAFFPSSFTREGNFSNDLSAKPVLFFPSAISVIAGYEKRFILSSQGPIDRVSIEPELPFNFKEFSMTVKTESEGVTIYTITAYHGSESTQTMFSVYCGSCPTGSSLIITNVRFIDYYDLPDIETPHAYKSKQSFCIDKEAFTMSVRVSFGSRPISITLEEDGCIFYDNNFMSSGQSHLLHLFIHRQKPITFSSQIAYSVTAPPKNWATVSFDDSAWEKGEEGSWGVAAAAWFRAPFQMTKEFSYCRVLLRGEGSATLFVNGYPFSSTLLTETGTSVVLPSSFLAGNNVIAVELAKEPSSTLCFGLSVWLTNSPRLRMKGGAASAVQDHPDPMYPPENAFDEATNAWMTDSVPAELIYTFNNGTQQVVNELLIGRDLSTRPYAMQIVGVNGEERVTLAFFNRGSLVKEYTYLNFTNTRAFNSYHFIFTASNLLSPIAISSVLLFNRPIYTCPKKFGFKDIADGTTLYRGCPLGFTGRKQLSCVHENNTTFWKESCKQCYPTNPTRNFEYLDLTFTVFTTTRDVWKAERMTEMLAEETYIRDRDISYLYVDYAVDGEMTVVTVFSRCVVKRGVGTVIKRDLEKISPHFSQLVSKWMGAECMANIESVRVRHYVNWVMVIIIVMVCVIVTVVVAVYFNLRQKKGGVTQVQKEINSNSGENASLLV